MSLPFSDEHVRRVKLPQRGAPTVTIMPDGRVLLEKQGSAWMLTPDMAKSLAEALQVPPPAPAGASSESVE